MSKQNLQFDLGALDTAGRKMDAAVDDLVSTTQALLAEVSDVTVLGTNDTLGGIASMLYGLVLERVNETITSIQTEYGAQGGKLREARQAYADVEDSFTQSAGMMMEI
ncbi:hypothetical protein ACSDQ9_00525 [Aestuariimicrobium soli]|uniref:hypothetical protein n=1 Tax=Aestuariimicrobium soli TaxID=2035834 RepID=UPI003EBBBFE8